MDGLTASAMGCVRSGDDHARGADPLCPLLQSSPAISGTLAFTALGNVLSAVHFGTGVSTMPRALGTPTGSSDIAEQPGFPHAPGSRLEPPRRFLEQPFDHDEVDGAFATLESGRGTGSLSGSQASECQSHLLRAAVQCRF